MKRRLCGARDPKTGFFCVRLEGHDGDHLSVDNRVVWQGSPGAPVFWPNEQLRREITAEMLDPTLTDTEAGVRPKTPASEALLKGYTGDSCDQCGSVRMRRNGTCLLCEDCGATTGCS